VLGDPRVVHVAVRDARVGPFLAKSTRAPHRPPVHADRDVLRDGKVIGQVEVEIDSASSTPSWRASGAS